jgi:ankyrin repeat protein
MEMCRFSGLNDVEYGKVVAAINKVLETTTRLAPFSKNTVLTGDQRQKILDSLRFNQIDARHATIKIAHAKTCKWLLKECEYQDWLDDNKVCDHHGFLWIKGKPATGKSTIMKFAYANAKKTLGDTIVISFFFNARGEHLEKSTLGMYRSLLFQLLEKLPELQNLFDLLGSSAPNNFNQWDIEIVKDLFRSAIENLGRHSLTCFIDALDECEEDEVREMVTFFESLGQTAVSSKIRLRVCFSSRHYPTITIQKSVQLVLEGQEGHQQDIANYLHSELKAGRSKLVDQIKDEILERASGIFLWVVLVVQMLNKEFDRGRIHALRKRLDEIPNGLDELFQDILTRDSQNIEELILCLQWILYAKRPLKREELYFAILAGVAPEAVAAWSPEDITKQDMERFVLNSSKGFAETTKSRDQTVQFIHESVREFFLKENGLTRLQLHLGSNFPGLSHDRLKQCCQTYMRIDTSEYLPSDMLLPTASSEDVKDLRRLASEKFPFLEYATCNILYHADSASGYGISQKSFVENFFLKDWVKLDNLFEKYQIRRHTPDASLLYILAEKNLPNLIYIKLEQVQCIDIEGERYGFPLHVALANKNESALRALLIPHTGSWPNSDTTIQKSPPILREYQESIGLLLENGRDISSQKNRTLLSWAKKKDHEAIVRLLLETGKVNVNSRDNNNTLLLWAAERGHEAIVKLLLRAGKVNINSKDYYNRTPLFLAAENEHEAIIKLLLETGKVNVNSKVYCGWTLLFWAAKEGHETLVKLLLETGKVDVDSKGSYGQTPLSGAVEGGHEAIVKLLLETGKVNIDSKDNCGWTPLLRAVDEGHEAVVKLLLETGKVNVNWKGYCSRTPLLSAALRGHEAVVKLLLETGKVNIDSQDDSGWTPLLWAVKGGHEAIVKLLLENGADTGIENRSQLI